VDKSGLGLVSVFDGWEGRHGPPEPRSNADVWVIGGSASAYSLAATIVTTLRYRTLLLGQPDCEPFHDDSSRSVDYAIEEPRVMQE